MGSLGDVLGTVGGLLGGVGAIVAAVAAVFAAKFTRTIMESSQRQVEVSQHQFKQSEDAARDAQLPVLMPSTHLASAGYGTQTPTGAFQQLVQLGYDRAQPFVRVGLKNVGAGLALNIRAIVFESEPELELHKVTGLVHWYRYSLPLMPGDEVRQDWKGTGYPLTGDKEIGTTRRCKLFAPGKPSAVDVQRGHTEKVARLTITYADIFGRKHAAIYDFTAQNEWENVAYLSDISDDLGDLERRALRDAPAYGAPAVQNA